MELVRAAIIGTSYEIDFSFFSVSYCTFVVN